jgi:hypothetical protein
MTEVTEPELIEFVNERIRDLEGQFTVTPVTKDTDQRSVHMLSDGKPPSPQSPELPPQFVRRVGRWED